MKLWVMLQVFWINSTLSSPLGFDGRENRMSNDGELIEAVSDVVMNYLADEIGTKTFIASERGIDFGIRDFQDELFHKLNTSLRRVETLSGSPEIVRTKRRIVVPIIRSFNDFIEIYGRLTPAYSWFDGFYLIVSLNGEIAEVGEIFRFMWKIQLFNVNVLFRSSDGGIVATTFMPFRENNCNDVSPIVTSRFENGKFHNVMDDFFPDKTKNLHNCPIRISVSNESQPYIISDRSSDGTYTLRGGEISLMHALSKSLNFRADYAYIGSEGYLFENGSAEGPLEALVKGDVDISISNWWLKAHRLKYFDATKPFNNDPVLFIIPPGHDLNAFEKIVWPFSFPFWILIFVYAFAGSIIIFVIKSRFTASQSFVFGSGVRNPYFNMFIGLIGGIQKKLPKRNFARYILMVYLMYTLVVRTLYQASFYQLIKSNKRHEQVHSIDEMVEQDFTFYTYKGNIDVFSGTEYIKRRLVLLGMPELWHVMKVIQTDSFFHGAIGRSHLRILYAIQQGHQFSFCNDILLTMPVVIYTKKRFCLMEAFNRNLEIFTSAGFINFWHFEAIDRRVLEVAKSEQRKSLTIAELMGCFQVLFLGWGFSVFVFITELLSTHCDCSLIKKLLMKWTCN